MRGKMVQGRGGSAPQSRLRCGVDELAENLGPEPVEKGGAGLLGMRPVRQESLQGTNEMLVRTIRGLANIVSDALQSQVGGCEVIAAQ
jgi:hypothetical protein